MATGSMLLESRQESRMFFSAAKSTIKGYVALSF